MREEGWKKGGGKGNKCGRGRDRNIYTGERLYNKGGSEEAERYVRMGGGWEGRRKDKRKGEKGNKRG